MSSTKKAPRVIDRKNPFVKDGKQLRKAGKISQFRRQMAEFAQFTAKAIKQINKAHEMTAGGQVIEIKGEDGTVVIDRKRVNEMIKTLATEIYSRPTDYFELGISRAAPARAEGSSAFRGSLGPVLVLADSALGRFISEGDFGNYPNLVVEDEKKGPMVETDEDGNAIFTDTPLLETIQLQRDQEDNYIIRRGDLQSLIDIYVAKNELQSPEKGSIFSADKFMREILNSPALYDKVPNGKGGFDKVENDQQSRSFAKILAETSKNGFDSKAIPQRPLPQQLISLGAQSIKSEDLDEEVINAINGIHDSLRDVASAWSKVNLARYDELRKKARKARAQEKKAQEKKAKAKANKGK